MKITITGYTASSKIPPVKAIRAISHLSLKEAKDLVDSLADGNGPVDVELYSTVTLGEAYAALHDGGVTFERPSLWQRRPKLHKPHLPASLTIGVPVYVTRPTADGRIGDITVNAWAGVAAVLLATCNIIGWSIYGLFVLVEKI